ncbi:MAG: addiction module protein [Acidobacteriota bacterium]|jgi:hypothetical protein|nr:addiction module protein [Acidobacteriota bacterium]
MAITFDVEKLTVAERVELFGRLVDTLTPDTGFDLSPAWHKDVLSERARLENSGKVAFFSAEELLQKFKAEGLCK